MRTLGLVAVALTGLGLSGCSQVSSIFKKKPHYHTADGSAVYVDSDAHLRTTPQQPYQFSEHVYSDHNYDGTMYDGAAQYASYTPYNSVSQYAGYEVELYNQQPTYTTAAFADPRDTEFVMLNGKSEPNDWRFCESMNRGYLFMSETDFRLDPEFEVCMRNKGYVMTTESGPTSKQILSAQTVGLRGLIQPIYTQPTYPSHTQSSYPSYY